MTAWRHIAVIIVAQSLAVNAPDVAYAQSVDPIELRLNKTISEFDSLSSIVQTDQRFLQNTIYTYITKASAPDASAVEVNLILSESNRRFPGLSVKYRDVNDYCRVLRRLQDWRQNLNARLMDVLDRKLRLMTVRHLYQVSNLSYDIEQFAGEPFDKRDLQDVYKRAIVDLQIEDPSPSEVQDGWHASVGGETEKLLSQPDDDVIAPCD